MSILDIVLSVVSGGATGLLGAGMQLLFGWLGKREDRKNLEMRNAHEIALRKADAEIMAQEWAARTKVAETEADAAKDVEASRAFAASFKMEPVRYSDGVKPAGWQRGALVLVDVVRGLIRPGLTIYLCAVTTLIYFQARGLLAQENLDAAQALALMDRIIQTVLYLTTTCVLWWFGTRMERGAPR